MEDRIGNEKSNSCGLYRIFPIHATTYDFKARGNLSGTYHCSNHHSTCWEKSLQNRFCFEMVCVELSSLATKNCSVCEVCFLGLVRRGWDWLFDSGIGLVGHKIRTQSPRPWNKSQGLLLSILPSLLWSVSVRLKLFKTKYPIPLLDSLKLACPKFSLPE